jgi:hypothetical protein
VIQCANYQQPAVVAHDAELAATVLPYFSSRTRVPELIAMKEIVT